MPVESGRDDKTEQSFSNLMHYLDGAGLTAGSHWYIFDTANHFCLDSLQESKNQYTQQKDGGMY